jgi:hypothetical protein
MFKIKPLKINLASKASALETNTTFTSKTPKAKALDSKKRLK